MNSREHENVVLNFILATAGTVAALWMLFNSNRGAPSTRRYLPASQT